MEYDSESSCEDRERNTEASRRTSEKQVYAKQSESSPISWSSIHIAPLQSKEKMQLSHKSLSTQVMEYYRKYSRNSNLDQYFSLPASGSSPDAAKYYYGIYESSCKIGTDRQDCVGEEYNLKSYVPRERRRWVRPPLIGQSSGADTSSGYIRPLAELRTPSPDLKQVTPETIPEERRDGQENSQETVERKAPSPTSSVTSHKPLEWDSGADVGYFNTLPRDKKNDKRLSTIERMALARGCSTALRLDPEGTTESGISARAATVVTASDSNAPNSKAAALPKATSTPLQENISGSDSEIEITPIVKNHLPGVITGDDIKSDEKKLSCSKEIEQGSLSRNSRRKEQSSDTPRSSFAFKVPAAKCPETKRLMNRSNLREIRKEPVHSIDGSPLKKSTSMNTICVSPSKLALKRSQSELNLPCTKDKNKSTLPLIFNSTSSLATIVNKPITCDKLIQTNLNMRTQESVGIQVSSVRREEKPPLPKRGTSLGKNSLHSILKNSSNGGTYKVIQESKRDDAEREQSQVSNNRTTSCQIESNNREKTRRDTSENESTSATPQPDDTENVTGRANSFEYFPGHIYENVPNGSESRVSSVDTGLSNSSLPNTSSSINDKLWGDSDSLVRDLERSVNILKTLVDANKCDKRVKKRLIHHVVKRLVTARYTDDKIEHNLEDNVPWNPDDARRKVYRAEILRALTRKRSTTDSSDDWKTQVKPSDGRKSDNDVDVAKELKKVVLDSSNSDKFDGQTDRTEMDGRKARMGLRAEDCHRNSDTPTDPTDKSESSECFFPQRGRKNDKTRRAFCLKEKCKIPPGESTATNSTPPDRNRILLEAVVNNRGPLESSNDTENNAVDWRLPTTLSERRFELKKCSNSDSGDSKLVSYAEMEKRNQLIWITNEISHLCNLKKLLEQPRKLERPRSSPRKPKVPKQRQTTHLPSRPHDQTMEDGTSAGTERNSIDRQWSSHCNLATCQVTENGIDAVLHVRKRNSCTQTATEVSVSHSKTGGEVVSTSTRQTPLVTLVSTGVQAFTQCVAQSSVQSETVHCTGCHKAEKRKTTAQQTQYDYTCNEQTCGKCRERNSAHTESTRETCRCHLQSQKYSRATNPNECDVFNESRSESESHRDSTCPRVKQKDTKNRINASKSKYTCNCKQNGIEKTSVECKRISPECHVPLQELKEPDSTENGRLVRGHNRTCKKCDFKIEEAMKSSINKYSTRCYRDTNGSISDSNDGRRIIKLCGSTKECACENKQETMRNVCENCSTVKSHWNEICHLDRCSTTNERLQSHAKYHYLSNVLENDAISQQPTVQINPKCNCNKDCSCAEKNRDKENFFYDTKHSTKSNYSKESTANNYDGNSKCYHSYSRPCESYRFCNCHRTYPKPIAYELSFVQENNQKNEVTNVSALPKVPLHNYYSANTAKANGCACEILEKNRASKDTQQKDTLRDYLSKNKPEFVGNAEIRRHYMSEIAHLRQLRNEKRIQLLAMATTSNMLIRSPKASKPTVCAQRKITDQEMKERLRKRYLGLNEVRSRKQQQEKQEETRRNKLMAKIFGKKLQQKVLRGQVDLSPSVSVISNI